MAPVKGKVVIGVPTPGLTGTPIPLRLKHRTPAAIKGQKSKSNNNARKSSQHAGEKWKTAKAASHRGCGDMNLPTK